MARRRVWRVLGWAAGRVPTLLVWAGLAGLFAYGAAHGWKFGEPEAKDKEKKEKPKADSPESDDFIPYYQPQPADVPVLVTHDPARCTAVARCASPEAAAAVLGPAGWSLPAGKMVRLAGVSSNCGATAFTRIPRGRSSMSRMRVRWARAALLTL